MAFVNAIGAGGYDVTLKILTSSKPEQERIGKIKECENLSSDKIFIRIFTLLSISREQIGPTLYCY
jgi:hypothetical protein